MGHENNHLYEFGAFRLDPSERMLARHGEPIPLAPKAFETLLILVQHRGHVLTKDQLIKTLWPDSFVEENNLSQQISQLRRALGEDNSGPGYIETVPKLGYRLACKVREIGRDEVDLIVSQRTRIVLREKLETEESREVADAPAPSPTVKVRWRRSRNTVLMAVALSFGLPLLVIYYFRSPSRVSVAAPTVGLVRLTSDSGLTMNPALSPDGKLVAYASDRNNADGNLDIWVQLVNGGGMLRLTKDTTDNYAPEFSPDGQTIAYRSELDGGGIYVVAVLGGEPRRIAAHGRRPKFSPDGKWVVYWVGTEAEDNTGVFLVPGAGKIFVVGTSGGNPRELCPDFAAAGYPIWAPDSKHILFLGNRDANFYHEDTMDWWVTSTDGGPLVRTEANTAFEQMGFASPSWAPEMWSPDGQAVLMSATLSDTRNIWRVPISSRDWKISGTPQRLTSGTATDVQPAIAGNRLVFASVSGNLNIWTLPIDTDRVQPTGVLERLTSNTFGHTYPAISSDGRKLAFSLQRAGNRDVWIKDLPTAKETQISTPPGPSFNPNFSPDGSILLYRMNQNKTSVAFAVSLSLDRTETICEDCTDYGWSSDQKRLALVGTSPARISVLDLDSKRRTALLNHAVYTLWNPRFSPDDRWISFNATTQGQSRIFVAPVAAEGLIREQEWIAIADSGWDHKPRWSPDGNTIYFVSQRDGFRCIWAQRLDARKHPVGAAQPVFHAHESQRSMSNVGPGDLQISVARDKLVFNMSERTGNLWMLKLP